MIDKTLVIEMVKEAGYHFRSNLSCREHLHVGFDNGAATPMKFGIVLAEDLKKVIIATPALHLVSEDDLENYQAELFKVIKLREQFLTLL
jgi:hypothetical protein